MVWGLVGVSGGIANEKEKGLSGGCGKRDRGVLRRALLRIGCLHIGRTTFKGWMDGFLA